MNAETLFKHYFERIIKRRYHYANFLKNQF